MSVITTEFVVAFESQCDALGYDGAAVVVPHPIQNRQTAEIAALADEAFPAIIAALAD